jgi:hypothetical protein
MTDADADASRSYALPLASDTYAQLSTDDQMQWMLLAIHIHWRPAPCNIAATLRVAVEHIYNVT